MSRRSTTLLLGLAIAAPILGSNWVSESATSVGGDTSVDCGTPPEYIPGKAGILVDWTHTKPNNKSLKSANGKCGAKWTGERFESCDADVVYEDSTCRHDYYRENGMQSTRVKVKVDRTTGAGGTATQKDETDPQWWWNPVVNIFDALPTVQVMKNTGESWVVDSTEAWTNQDPPVGNPYSLIRIHGTGGQGGAGSSNNPAPGATLTAGRAASEGGTTSDIFVAWTNPIGNTGSSAERKIRIEFHVYTDADTTADNCHVGSTPWEVFLASTMESWCDVGPNGN